MKPDPEPEDLPLTLFHRLSWKEAVEKMKHHHVYYIISIILAFVAAPVHAQHRDTSALRKADTVAFLRSLTTPVVAQDTTPVLKPVTVSGASKRDAFSTPVPSQSLDRRTLTQLNVPSVADAAKYFSGVLVKDYGGAGGLKTVSVRSLGASHTGVLYDGIPVSDVQTGQTDLGRYSSSFLHSLDLYQSHPPYQPAPARSSASASLVSMQSNAFSPNTMDKKWFAGIRQGSFGLVQPHAGFSSAINKTLFADATAELTTSKGDYPIFIENGALSRSSKRMNAYVDAWQAELNVLKQFSDSSTLQVKAFNYHSHRGLPGSVLLYNDLSEQRLRNTDQFVQARFKKQLAGSTVLLLSGKYNYSYTKYTDPAFQNNAGGLDNRYRQWESYFSAAISKGFQWFNVSLASDVAFSRLRSNMPNFAFPERWSTWNNLAIGHHDSHWKLDASLLLTTIHDKAKGDESNRIKKATPSFSAAFTPNENSPFLIRLFYKEAFRMPTFNDLYYVLIGNRNLRPEYARQINAGIVFNRDMQGLVQSVRISADGYYNLVRDKIVAVPSQNLFSWTMLNVGKVHIPGVDVTGELSGKTGGSVTWFARLAYTFQQAKDVTDKAAGNYRDRIPYTPDHSGSALVSVNWKHWNAGTSAIFSGTRYSIGDNSSFTQLDGWATADVFVSRSVNLSAFRLNVRAEMDNLADNHYDIVRSYPMPGRSYKLSVIISNK